LRRAAFLLVSGLALGPALGLSAGCGGASPESGVTAWMRIANAQFVPGTLATDTSGTEPLVRQVALMTSQVAPGQENVPVSGSVEKGSAVLIGLSGDSGYWIVPTTVLDLSLPDNYDFAAQMTFSPLTTVGSHSLIFRPVAADGTQGPAQVYPLAVAVAPPPTGQLVFSLSWDTQSDMDLHVDVPNPADPTKPIEIWYKAAVGVPIPGPGQPPVTPDQVAAAGYLDFDSNAACVIDGRRQENVIFPMAPPAGQYTVRVDANSLCGQAAAQWQVGAFDAYGNRFQFAQWQAIDSDTRGTHGVGSGRLAFQFQLPSP
jgi:hypothetical protein